MFVSFENDSGIRFSAHFYNVKDDTTTVRPVTGWVTSDDGMSQATVLVAEQGLQVRVGSFGDFLAVVPNGQESEFEELLKIRKDVIKKAAEVASK